jgi:23S rRNA pseudouridine1911/1915/1917 synthase
VKLSSRTVLKIARLYHIADDITPVRALRNLRIDGRDEYVFAKFILNKTRYALLFGSIVQEETLDELWSDRPQNARALPNPLDADDIVAPFQGKFVVLYELPSEKVRLDAFLAGTFDTSRSRSLWQKYVKSGAVQVNGQVVTSPKTEIETTDEITVELPEQTADATDIPVLYEDEDIVVINKPAGVLTHAKGGISQEHTVADMLQPLTTFASDTNRAGIVHRLDRETSGVLVGARTPAAAEFLQKQFAQRTTKKTYIAIVEGVPKHTEALIDLPIGRSPAKPSTFRVDPKGKSAQTTYYVLDVQNDKSLVKLQPKTGRTHQLRVHMAHIGHPIVGDIVYGKSAQRMFLHAYQLELTAPNGERMTFTAPIPEEFLRDFPEVKL